MILQSTQSFLFWLQKWSNTKISQHFKKTVSFDNMVHFFDVTNIVTYVEFDCSNILAK